MGISVRSARCRPRSSPRQAGQAAQLRTNIVPVNSLPHKVPALVQAGEAAQLIRYLLRSTGFRRRNSFVRLDRLPRLVRRSQLRRNLARQLVGVASIAQVGRGCPVRSGNFGPVNWLSAEDQFVAGWSGCPVQDGNRSQSARYRHRASPCQAGKAAQLSRYLARQLVGLEIQFLQVGEAAQF